MTSTSILVSGIVCFALTIVGVILTVYEFKNIARESAARATPARPLALNDEPERVGTGR
ncbi:MAG: hypothetical protein O3C28_04300 [Proteobacteria bacterium]|nr:hypothetical protein [Pseudomonadota bacterium]